MNHRIIYIVREDFIVLAFSRVEYKARALLWYDFMGIESEEGCARLMRSNEFLGKQESEI